jgi:hypothetical protein
MKAIGEPQYMLEEKESETKEIRKKEISWQWIVPGIAAAAFVFLT